MMDKVYKNAEIAQKCEIYNEYSVKTRDKCQVFEEMRCVEY